jgi:TnpA family transposase
VSDQSTVFGTQVISCSPREALYVLDGLLANNTILQIRDHTTDTHGFTVILTLAGYTRIPVRGERGRSRPTGLDDTPSPRLGSR